MGERPRFYKILAAVLLVCLLTFASVTVLRPAIAAAPISFETPAPPPSTRRLGRFPLGPRPPRVIAAPPEVFHASARKGANNCLFEAVIEAGDIRSPKDGTRANPQLLREVCMRELKKDPMVVACSDTEAAQSTGAAVGARSVVDAVSDGNVTGGEFLAILSKVLRVKIHVNVAGSTARRGWMPDLIAYDAEIAEDASAPIIHIRHIGDADFGHWEASSDSCGTCH